MKDQIAVDKVKKCLPDEIRLSSETLAVQERINEDVVLKTDYNVIKDIIRDDIIARITIKLLGRKVGDLTIKHPKTWWDSFKLRWYPYWLLKAFPPDYTTLHFDAKEFIPESDLDKVVDTFNCLVRN